MRDVKLGLCMVIKNEGYRLRSWLPSARTFFDQFIAVDTGSTDDTIAALKECGASVFNSSPSADDPFNITEARNQGLRAMKTDWILVLDADESMNDASLGRIREAIQATANAYFLTWRNHADGTIFDDYKLALFRSSAGVSFEGAVHPNAQWSLRRGGLTANCLYDVIINHSLDERKVSRDARKGRLERYIKYHPTWWRYHWFLGYTYFKDGDLERAIPLLRDTCNSLSREFPVECLNAHMVLTNINARKFSHDKCRRIIIQAAQFFDQVSNDFEVQANRKLGPWIKQTQQLIAQQLLSEINAYDFAY